MKNIYTLTFIMALTLEISAQDYTNKNQNLDYVRQLQSNQYINQEDSSFTFLFNSPTDSVLYNKSISKYNDQGDLVLQETRYPETADDDRRKEIVYQENKRIETLFKFDKNDEKWVEHIKYEELYSNDLLQTKIDYSWREGEWKEIDKETFKYNENNSVTENIVYKWDEDLQDWALSSKREMIYNDKGNETLQQYYLFTDSKFEPFEKVESIYEGELKIEEKEYRLENDVWIDLAKSDYIYYENGDLKEMTDYLYNKHVDEWDKESQLKYTYFSDDLIDEFTLIFFDRVTGGVSFIISYESIYDNTTEALLVRHYFGDDLTTIERKTYYYNTSQQVTSLNDNLVDHITVYPNPSTDNIIVKSEKLQDKIQLQLFSLTGKSIYKNTVFANEPINIKSIPSGLLIYKISKNGKLLRSGKLIKN